MLARWLPDSEDKLPANPSHQVRRSCTAVASPGLCRRLCTGIGPDSIRPICYRAQVGVGAFVFDRREQKVLMVQEKNGPLTGENAWEIATLVANLPRLLFSNLAKFT